MNNINIEQLPSFEFSFERWNAGTYLDLGFYNGHFDIRTPVGQNIIRKHAIGYCPGESLEVRPKLDCTAVMYFIDGICFWSHLTNQEFNMIFRT